MKDNYPKVSLVRFCRLLGFTRQSYYKHYWSEEEYSIEEELVLKEVRTIRNQMPVIGTRKLFVMLQSFLLEHQVKMGRDALFNLLAHNKLLVSRRRYRITTTQSNHWLRKYPNLIKDVQIVKANQVWVADITYYKTQAGFVYISLITDAYSHKIMGYHVADNLSAINCMKALKMALSNKDNCYVNLTHHSDRGLQYCSIEYVSLLQEKKIKISMTESGDPRDNAIAERVNGILKEEFLKHWEVKDHKDASLALENAVHIYNELRPHFSCSLFTPEVVHQNKLTVTRLWKNYYKKRDKIALLNI